MTSMKIRSHRKIIIIFVPVQTEYFAQIDFNGDLQSIIFDMAIKIRKNPPVALIHGGQNPSF